MSTTLSDLCQIRPVKKYRADPFFSYGRRVGRQRTATGDDVVAVLDAVKKRRQAVPNSIRVDSGPEFMSKSLDWWAYFNEVNLDFIRPGKSTDNVTSIEFLYHTL